MNAAEQRINIYGLTVDGAEALGFDSGLDARSFAQARIAQYLSEPGYIVTPDGGITPWKASGVIEANNPTSPHTAPTMHIWGPAFTGIRFDILISDSSEINKALAAIINWINARLALDAEGITLVPPLWPCAAFIADAEFKSHAAKPGIEKAPLITAAIPQGTVFFAPENLTRRCIQAEGEEARLRRAEQYVHPDLKGIDGAAWTASAMLYRIFAGTGAWTALNEDVLHSDMRERNFLPIRLAAPGIDPKLASLIQETLADRQKNSGVISQIHPSAEQDSRNTPLPCQLTRLRQSLEAPAREQKPREYFYALSQTEQDKLAEEKQRFLKRNKARVNTTRFIIRNTAIILGLAAALLITVLIGVSIAKKRASAPSTAGMDSLTVVSTYYKAMSALDHEYMEACTAKGAGKSDINMAASLFVITRVRQAYEYGTIQFIPPDEWLKAGKPALDIPVFGITDLHITHLSGDEETETVNYRASYTLWVPISEADNGEPCAYNYTDELTLSRIRKNWRITEIKRNA